MEGVLRGIEIKIICDKYLDIKKRKFTFAAPYREVKE